MVAGVRPKVLVFVGHYLPGFKAGGIPRSVENIVNHLYKDYQFMIVTRDRDFGDDDAYPSICANDWQPVGNASVFYLTKSRETVPALAQVIRDARCDFIYLNSFFDPLTIKVLLNVLLGQVARLPVLVAPRGEFSWASLRIKYPRKLAFIIVARLIGLYRTVWWHAASELETAEIAKVMKIPCERMRIALDLSTSAYEAETQSDQGDVRAQGDDRLRIIFLSRISPEKNLDFALRVLKECHASVIFDIAGPKENVAHWNECERLIHDMPATVQVRYRGSVEPTRVIVTLKSYDLLLLPSGGESYGHVIGEALTAGTPVLISTNTPWRDLEKKRLGWDISLDRFDSFVKVVDAMATKSPIERSKRRQQISADALEILANPAVVQSNRNLFNLRVS